MTERTKEELQAFYLTHSNAETAAFLGMSKSQMLRVLDKLQIKKKTPFKNHAKVADTLVSLYTRIDKDEFISDCKMMTQERLCDKYQITIRQLQYIKDDLKIGARLNYLSKADIDKDAFEKYYRQHTLADTAKQFNLSGPASVKNLLKMYCIQPDKRIAETVVEAAGRIDKDTLADYYKNHTFHETQEHFKCKILSHLLKYYNIENKTKQHVAFKDVVARIDKSAFISDFEKLNIYELFIKYDISYTTYRKLSAYWELGYKPGVFAYQDASLSSYEDDLYNVLLALATHEQIVRHDRDMLDGQELDFYIPSKRLGIEFNGDYWHSDLKKDRNYHYDKSKRAEKKNIRLIHIWEYEWQDPKTRQKLIQTLKIALGHVERKIYARKCSVRQISNKEAKPFNERTHLQGHRNAQVTYGLFYEDELVQLMSFSRTRYNKNLISDTEWEIIRGCPGSNNIVIGGVAKLLSHFIKDYKPSKIFSYCDFNKFDGKSYEKAGMRFIGYTGPDLKYMLQDGVVVNRSPKNYKYNSSHCQFRLFGAGSKKFEFILADPKN